MQQTNTETGDFGAALNALKNGYFLKRRGWDEEFIFLVRPSFVSAEKIQDDRIKGVMGLTNLAGLKDSGNIRLMNSKTGEVVNGWTPTQDDMLAIDWSAYEMPDVVSDFARRCLRNMIKTKQGPDEFIDTILRLMEKCNVKATKSEDGGSITLDDVFPGYRIVADEDPHKPYCVYAPGEDAPMLMGNGDIVGELNGLHNMMVNAKLSDREFRLNSLSIYVVGERDLPADITLSALKVLEDHGQVVVNFRTVAVPDSDESSRVIGIEGIDAMRAVRAVKRAGKDPAMFNLTETGEDVGD